MKGLILSAPMVHARREGRKTCTRRIMNPQPPAIWDKCKAVVNGDGDTIGWCFYNSADPDFHGYLNRKHYPHYLPGEEVYIKEAWRTLEEFDTLRPSELPATPAIWYLVSNPPPIDTMLKMQWGRYRHARFMPERFARDHAVITDVRAERLQEITPEECLKEGIDLPIPLNCDISPPPDGYDKWPKSKQEEWIGGMARTVYFARLNDVQDHLDTYRTLWESIHGPGSWDANPMIWRIGLADVPAAPGRGEP